jgi:hypothetical protein
VGLAAQAVVALGRQEVLTIATAVVQAVRGLPHLLQDHQLPTLAVAVVRVLKI